MSGDARLIDSYWHYYRMMRVCKESEAKSREQWMYFQCRVEDAKALLKHEGLWDTKRDMPCLRDPGSTSPATSAAASSAAAPTTQSEAGSTPT